MGENLAGTWTLRIGDDVVANSGQFNGWVMGLTLCPAPPKTLKTTVVNDTLPPLTLTDGGASLVDFGMSQIPGTVWGIIVITSIMHHISTIWICSSLHLPG